MDLGYKAMLTALAVAAVMMAARLFDRRIAGLMAGLPVITAPALMWLAHDQGAAFAARSAAGSVAACALAPLYAWVFVTFLTRHGPALALSSAVAVAAAAAAALQPLRGQLPVILLACAVACVAVRTKLHLGQPTSGIKPLPGEPWLSAALAGTVTALVSLLAARLGPFWSGLLSSLPVITTFALLHLARSGTPPDLHRFVQGYLHGIWAKALFACGFALVARELGGAWGLLAGAVAGVASMAATTLLPRKRGAVDRLARAALRLGVGRDCLGRAGRP